MMKNDLKKIDKAYNKEKQKSSQLSLPFNFNKNMAIPSEIAVRKNKQR